MRYRSIAVTALIPMCAGAAAAQQAPPPPSLIDRLSEPLHALPHHDGTARATPVDPGLAQEVNLLIEADFTIYDRDGDGRLSRPEFATWMATLRPDPGAGSASGSWVATAFADADADHDDRVDRRELAAFLIRTVGWRLRPGAASSVGPAAPGAVRSGPAPEG